MQINRVPSFRFDIFHNDISLNSHQSDLQIEINDLLLLRTQDCKILLISPSLKLMRRIPMIYSGFMSTPVTTSSDCNDGLDWTHWAGSAWKANYQQTPTTGFPSRIEITSTVAINRKPTDSNQYILNTTLEMTFQVEKKYLFFSIKSNQ